MGRTTSSWTSVRPRSWDGPLMEQGSPNPGSIQDGGRDVGLGQVPGRALAPGRTALRAPPTGLLRGGSRTCTTGALGPSLVFQLMSSLLLIPHEDQVECRPTGPWPRHPTIICIALLQRASPNT
ncbi:unnamed protein product [Boreogadus saida]